MGTPFDAAFAKRLRHLKDDLLPYLKSRVELLEEDAHGSEISPEPDSPRAYVPGEDARSIDWNLFARLDRLYLKTVVREEEVPFLLLLDASGSMGAPDGGKLRTALQVAAALADIHLSLGSRVLVAPWADGLTGSFGPFSGENEFADLLKSLETVAAAGVSDLRKSVRQASATGQRAAPVIISDFLYPADFGDVVDLLVSSGLPVAALQVLSPEELGQRLRGNLVVTDPERDGEERMQAGYRTHRRYREAFAAHLAAVSSLFSSRGALFRSTVSSRPFEEAVRGLQAPGEARGR